MNIALDYDYTYTADKTLFDYFVLRARSRGHKVYVITARGGEETEKEWPKQEVIDDLQRNVDEIIFVGHHQSKLDAVTERGIKIDIWMDDNPHVIVMTPSLIPGWRKNISKEELNELKNGTE